MPSRPDPTEKLRAHFRSERHAIDRHPSPEQIVAYHEQRLSPGEAEDVRMHLAACPDCTSQLLALADLYEEEDPDARISHAELDAAWERQRDALFPPAPVVSLPRRTPLRRDWATASLGLAAALLAIVSFVQWRTIVELRQPQTNPPLVNLEPVGSVRQSAQAPRELRFSADAQRAWVILNPVTELDAPAYEVEVAAPDGTVVLHLDLQRSEVGNFRLEIPRAVLAEGDYRIVLFGRKAGSRETAGEFVLRVRPAPLPAP